MNEPLKRPEAGKRNSLGRGLSALFGEASEDFTPPDRNRPPKQLPIEFIHAGRFQPRRRFDTDAAAELIQSIKEKGVLQPLLVRRDPDQTNSYEIIAGERRWRAAQAAGLHELPVIIRDLSDREALEISIIENVQRQDLSPLEEAEGYRRLLDEFQHTQEELARVVGKSRSHIANTLRLLALPEPIKTLVYEGALTAGHARALLTAPNALEIADEVVAKGLNVRQTEQLARGDDAHRPIAIAKAAPPKDADLLHLEQELATELGLKVSISSRGSGGTISIQYKTLDQFDDLYRRLKPA